MFRLKLSENKIAITYKLLNDFLFLLLIFLALSLIAEGLLPGIVSNHLSFLKIVLSLAITILVVYIIGGFLKTDNPKRKFNKKIAVLLAILATVLIFNSLLKLNLILAIIILILVISSGYLVYKTIIEN